MILLEIHNLWLYEAHSQEGVPYTVYYHYNRQFDFIRQICLNSIVTHIRNKLQMDGPWPTYINQISHENVPHVANERKEAS